jgi:hypothetical protein
MNAVPFSPLRPRLLATKLIRPPNAKLHGGRQTAAEMKCPSVSYFSASAKIAAEALFIIGWLLCLACGRSDQTPDLHAAAMPIQPLVHVSPQVLVRYPEKFPEQVALLITSKDDATLAPIRILQAMGIPFFVTRDLHTALRHKLVLIYPGIEPNSLPPEAVGLFEQHMIRGGTIFAQNVFWRALEPTFGVEGYLPLRSRHHMALTGVNDEILQYLDRPQEREVQLGSPTLEQVIWTNGYSPTSKGKVLARFEDGSAAVVTCSRGKGRSYLIGLSFDDVVTRNQQNRDFEAQRIYVNGFEPGTDIWLLMLRAWYETYSESGVRIATIPDGMRSALMLSHDVDWEYSFQPALQFAKVERSRGLSSTLFVQTKYLPDVNSRAFFFGKNLDVLREAKAIGADIESHTVLHSHGFNHAVLGSGHESYANYRARATGRDTAEGITALGETCVSKSLLDGEMHQQTRFFRSGHLRVPPSLPEALERCGYEFDSSFTADDVLTSFPYKLNLDLGWSEESSIYEFPVSIEDEESPLESRLDRTLDLIQANADNNAPTVILIHSNNADSKLKAEQELLQRLPRDILVTNMSDFARFWKARDELNWTVRRVSNHSLQLELTSELPVRGLTFSFRKKPKSVLPSGSAATARVIVEDKQIILSEVPAHTPVKVTVEF